MSYILAALFMGVVVIYITNLIENVFLSFIIGSIIGASIYFLILIFIKESTMRLILDKAKQKLVRR